ncbi:MAG: CoA transferase [Pseudomonadota bacterium]
MTGPLSGFKVLDLSAVVSGPLTGALLADQGADVIKIERVGSGDIQRHVGSQRHGFSGFFHVLNRGKRSLALNLQHPQGVAITRQLAATADVVIQNFRPGVATRLGVGYAQLCEANPALVYLSISGFGQSGPRAADRAYDPIIQTYAGIAAIQGRLDPEHPEQPQQVNMLLLDKLTAWTGSQAITAALLARSKSGQGQHIELSMLDTAIAFAWSDAAADLIIQGTDHLDARPPVGASGQLLQYADGWGATMTLTQQEFVGLCRAYGSPEVAEDPRFATLEARIAHREDLREVFSGLFAQRAAQMTVAEADSALAGQQVPFGIVRQLEELADDEQVLHNGSLRLTEHPVAGRLREARPAPIFNGTPLTPAKPAPSVGEHSEEILREMGLGEEFNQLCADGVVG